MITRTLKRQPSREYAPQDLNFVQDELERLSNDLASRPHLNSDFIEKSQTATITGLSLTAAQENLVEHGLGRTLRGWWLADIRGPAFVWRVATSTVDLAKFLPLACSANVTVTLVVF